MITIGASSSMESPTRSRRSKRNSLRKVRAIVRNIYESNGSESVRIGNRIAQRMPGQRDEGVGKIGTVDAEFENLSARQTSTLEYLVNQRETFELKGNLANVARDGDLGDSREPVTPVRWRRMMKGYLHQGSAPAQRD